MSSRSITDADRDGGRKLARLRRRPAKPLERDGLIAVAVDPADRRNRLISLTQQGRAKLAETDALWAKAQRCFEAAFGGAESESLREALRFLISDGFAAAFEDTLSAPAR